MPRESSEPVLRRRQLLAIGGTVVTASVAGCTDSTDTDTPATDSPENTPTDPDTSTEPSDPGELTIQNADLPRIAASRDPINVDITVQNTGDETVSGNVSLTVDQEPLTSETVELPGGEQTTVSTVIPADITFDGEYTVTINTPDDTREVVLQVDHPNPYGQETLTVGLEQETPARHDMHEIVREALSYWEDYSEEFAGYGITYDYRPNASDPDVLIRLVENIHSCGGHTGEIAGCAPLVTTRAPDTAEIRIVDGYRQEWMTTTLKHEIGHTLGLDHDAEPAHIMSDEIEDRIPEYAARQEALDLYNDAFEPYSDGVQAWNRAMSAWGNRDSNATERAAIDAYDYFVAAEREIRAAKTIAGELNERGAEALLRETQTHISVMQSASEECIWMAQEAQQTFGNPEPHRENAQAYLDEANEYTHHEPYEISRAFGFPARQ